MGCIPERPPLKVTSDVKHVLWAMNQGPHFQKVATVYKDGHVEIEPSASREALAEVLKYELELAMSKGQIPW